MEVNTNKQKKNIPSQPHTQKKKTLSITPHKKNKIKQKKRPIPRDDTPTHTPEAETSPRATRGRVSHKGISLHRHAPAEAAAPPDPASFGAQPRRHTLVAA